MQLNRKLLLQPQYRFTDALLTKAGEYSFNLPAGTYFFELCGGGGQGGDGAQVGGGAGGGGGYGHYAIAVLRLLRPATCNVTVGAGGDRATGKGVRGGDATGAVSTGGGGGAGGYSGEYTLLLVDENVSSGNSLLASYIAWRSSNGEVVYSKVKGDPLPLSYVGGTSMFYGSVPENEMTPVVTYQGTTVTRWQTVQLPQGQFERYPAGDVFIKGVRAVSLGGGGGGGGGGYAPGGRYPVGGGGGSGGGYCDYIIDEETDGITRWNYNGQTGPTANNFLGGLGLPGPGKAGINGNMNFPNIKGGNAGDGSGVENKFPPGGTGGGASGAAGCTGKSNGDPQYNTAGGGGGGAGGDSGARGGFAGESGYHPATDATNASVWPLGVYSNTGKYISGDNNSNPTFGMGGRGGTAANVAGLKGADGWVQITKL